MDKYERFAVGHHLCSWPQTIGFKELLEKLNQDELEDEDEDIEVHCTYEDMYLCEVGGLIADMVTTLRREF